MTKLELQPISFKEACEFIEQHHRHHLPPVGWKYGIAVNDGKKVVGVITIGRPVARYLDDGWSLEITRCCTDGTPNACSMLYGAACRAALAMGYKQIITYTLKEESGASLIGAGYKRIRLTRGGSWSCKSRPRIDKHPLGQKVLWAKGLPGVLTKGEGHV